MLPLVQRIVFCMVIVFSTMTINVQSSSHEIPKKELNIVFNFERPPFMFDKTSSKGIEADLITEALWEQGYKVNISQMFTQSAREHLGKVLLQRKQYDGFSAVASKNDDGLFYSDHFIEYENYAVTRSKDNLKISSVSDLKNLKVIAWKGAYNDLGDTFHHLFNPVDGLVKHDLTASASQMIDLEIFLAGKRDVLVVDQTIFKWFKITNAPNEDFVFHKIFPEITSFPVAFKSEKVRDDFNIGLAKIKQSGRYDEIVNFYNVQDVRPLLQMASLIADISAEYLLTANPSQLKDVLSKFFIHPDIVGIKVDSSVVSNSFVNLSRDNGKIRDLIEQPINYHNGKTAVFIPRVIRKSYSYDGGIQNPSDALFVGDVTLFYKRNAQLNNKRLIPGLSNFTALSEIELQQIVQAYNRHGLKTTKIVLTAAEQKWIEEHRVLKYSGRPDWLPFESFNEQGKYIGIAAEYLKIIESLIGIEFNFVVSKTKSDPMALINSQAVEMITMCMDPSLSTLFYTDPLISNDLVIVMRDNHEYVDKIEDIAHLKIGLVSGHSYNSKLINQHPSIPFIKVVNAQTAISDVSTGKIDAVILTFAHANHTIKKIGANSVRVVGKTNSSADIRLAVRQEHAPLISILNKAISMIPENEKVRIVDQWVKSENVKYTDYSLLWKLTALVSFILLIVIFWNRKMALEMAKRRIIERQLLEAKEVAESATRAKSDFLANMSHEIRTPINSILGMTYLALKTELTAKQQNYIEKVHRSAGSLLGVINDILDFSKIEAGKLTLEQVEFQLGDIFEDIASMLGMKAEEKGLELLFDIDLNVPLSMTGDPLRLTQILINLINNAIKFTEQGEIVLAVKMTKKENGRLQLLFTIKDTGLGISEDKLSNLFSSFNQADSSTTRQYGGTGLGLAISKRLTEMMGGKIHVESVLGQGSCFSFSCWLTEGSNHSAAYYLQDKSVQGMKILVVDDNDSSREILRSILSSLKFNVDVCEDGYKALDKINSASFDPYQLVIMDWKMPGIDGIEVIRQLQDTPNNSNIPICIVVTAHGREDVIKNAQHVDIKCFLTKPVTPSTLFDSIIMSMGKQVVTYNRQSKHKHENQQWAEKLRGSQVLLVEDNKLNQELAMELLGMYEIGADIAENGQQAIDLLKVKKYDGVLMDCQMPIMDGYTATIELRKLAEFSDLPIIAMTANTMVGDREKALSAGMNDHIAKPIIPESMFKTMAKWISPREKNETDLNKADFPIKVQQPSPDGLPALSAEIDINVGLHHCFDKVALYKKLLGMFVNNHKDFMVQFNLPENQQHMDDKIRFAHTLKGVSANLGLMHVHRYVVELESAYQNLSNDEDIVCLAEKIESEINKVIKQLEGRES